MQMFLHTCFYCHTISELHTGAVLCERASVATFTPHLYLLSYSYRCGVSGHSSSCALTSGVSVAEFVMSWQLEFRLVTHRRGKFGSKLRGKNPESDDLTSLGKGVGGGGGIFCR